MPLTLRTRHRLRPLMLLRLCGPDGRPIGRWHAIPDRGDAEAVALCGVRPVLDCVTWGEKQPTRPVAMCSRCRRMLDPTRPYPWKR